MNLRGTPGQADRGGEKSHRFDVIVVGGGLAGMATARALLVVDPNLKVALVEQEPVAALHASGRSAGMIRLAAEDPAITPIAREGRRTIAQIAAESSNRVAFSPVGSVLLGAERLTESRFEPGEVEPWGAENLADHCPFLGEPEGPISALWAPGDGRLEVDSWIAWLDRELERRRVSRLFSRRAIVPIVSEGQVRGVSCDEGDLRAPSIVLSVGAWAGAWARWLDARCGRLSAASVPKFDPRRRHIVETKRLEPTGSRGNRVVSHAADRQNDSPWIWDLDQGLYLRPSSESVLWSSCDAVSEGPGEPSLDPRAEEWLREKIQKRFPSLHVPAVTRVWSGHRTFLSDGRFLLGPDPRVKGWHWAVGLGGHGVTVSASVGRIVAELLLGVANEETQRLAEPHRVSRFHSCDSESNESKSRDSESGGASDLETTHPESNDPATTAKVSSP